MTKALGAKLKKEKKNSKNVEKLKSGLKSIVGEILHEEVANEGHLVGKSPKALLLADLSGKIDSINSTIYDQIDDPMQALFPNRLKFETTKRKTMALRIDGGGLHFFVVAVHAVEPKDEAMIADFVKHIGFLKTMGEELWRKAGSGQDINFILLSDTNLVKKKQAGFRAAIQNEFQKVAFLPQSVEWTTAKKRSYLHGQAYAAEKIKKIVTESKDKILVLSNGLSVEPLSVYPYFVYPRLQTSDKSTSPTLFLPRGDWPSDHSILWTTLVGSKPEAGTSTSTFFESNLLNIEAVRRLRLAKREVSTGTPVRGDDAKVRKHVRRMENSTRGGLSFSKI